jgi:hypothetical protein
VSEALPTHRELAEKAILHEAPTWDKVARASIFENILKGLLSRRSGGIARWSATYDPSTDGGAFARNTHRLVPIAVLLYENFAKGTNGRKEIHRAVSDAFNGTPLKVLKVDSDTYLWKQVREAYLKSCEVPNINADDTSGSDRLVAFVTISAAEGLIGEARTKQQNTKDVNSLIEVLEFPAKTGVGNPDDRLTKGLGVAKSEALRIGNLAGLSTPMMSDEELSSAVGEYLHRYTSPKSHGDNMARPVPVGDGLARLVAVVLYSDPQNAPPWLSLTPKGWNLGPLWACANGACFPDYVPCQTNRHANGPALCRIYTMKAVGDRRTEESLVEFVESNTLDRLLESLRTKWQYDFIEDRDPYSQHKPSAHWSRIVEGKSFDALASMTVKATRPVVEAEVIDEVARTASLNRLRLDDGEAIDDRNDLDTFPADELRHKRLDGVLRRSLGTAREYIRGVKRELRNLNDDRGKAADVTLLSASREQHRQRVDVDGILGWGCDDTNLFISWSERDAMRIADAALLWLSDGEPELGMPKGAKSVSGLFSRPCERWLSKRGLLDGVAGEQRALQAAGRLAERAIVVALASGSWESR